MYLHLGASVVIPQREVLAIYDLDNASWSHLTRSFLTRAEREGRLVSVGEDLPKSFLVRADREGNILVYLSQLSSATLLKRVESGQFEIR